MSSFDEKQATTLLKERPIEFVNYNKHQLSRVYPAGTRFDSSNFMPQVFWNAGCQLVALNYQTLDLGMQLNLGTYEYNRRCGYLLKPEFMRRKDRRLDPFAESTVDGIIAGTLSVTVLSGQLLTDKRCSTYVEVDMFGLPADTVRKKFRTKVVPNNGINPDYGEVPFVFKKVVLPELAVIRVAAHEEGGRQLGHRVLPVVGLRPGYRHVNLRTELGLPLPASLLLLIVVKDYVPDRLSELAEALANPIKYQSELDKREHQLAVLTQDTDVPQPPHSPQPPHRAHSTHDNADKHDNNDNADRTHGSAHPIRSDNAVDGSPLRVTVTQTTEFIVTESTPLPPPANDRNSHEAEGGAGGGADTGAAAALDALLSLKLVRDKQAELARKLDALRRKDKKPAATSKFYVTNRANKFVRKISSINMSTESNTSANANASSSTSVGEAMGPERELRLRYHRAIYDALEKYVLADQHHQMKALADQLEGEKKEILNKLANLRKEDVKALAKKTNRDKDEINRIKREIDSQSVQRGVEECYRLEATYSRRRDQLERAHSRLLQLLLARRDQDLVDLERMCSETGEG